MLGGRLTPPLGDRPRVVRWTLRRQILLLGAIQAASVRPDHAFPFWTYVENYLQRRGFNVTANQARDAAVWFNVPADDFAAALAAAAPAPVALGVPVVYVAQGVPVRWAPAQVAQGVPCIYEPIVFVD